MLVVEELRCRDVHVEFSKTRHVPSSTSGRCLKAGIQQAFLALAKLPYSLHFLLAVLVLAPPIAGHKFNLPFPLLFDSTSSLSTTENYGQHK
jgi:hypothetical protein